MRDLGERDEIREKYADQPGTGGQVERLMGERENAEAYGQDERAAQLDEALRTFGYTPAQVRAAKRKAAAEKRAADKDDAEAEARTSPPAERAAPAERQSKTDQPPKAKG